MTTSVSRQLLAAGSALLGLGRVADIPPPPSSSLIAALHVLPHDAHKYTQPCVLTGVAAIDCTLMQQGTHLGHNPHPRSPPVPCLLFNRGGGARDVHLDHVARLFARHCKAGAT